MSKRKKFRKKAIRTYWTTTNIWHDKFDSPEEFLEDGTCFACGFIPPIDRLLERAHIEPLCRGGKDKIENIHLLCIWCHQASEYLYDEKYWQWFHKRSIVNVLFTYAAQQNILPDLMKSLNKKNNY